MHNAPAVTYPAGRSFFAFAAMLAIWFLAAAGVALWSVQVQWTLLRMALAFAVLAATAAIALRSWLRTPAGTLSWDGLGWTWTGAKAEGDAGTPEVALDAQRLLLLRWWGSARHARHAQWLWLERSARPALWDDLRRAVYSRARPGALPGAPSSGEAKP
jgi:hypothetical protein